MKYRHCLRIENLAIGFLLVAALSSADSTAVATPSARTQTPLVINARWGGHCTYDRLVIDLKGYVPTVTVQPVAKLVYDGSGQRVPISGKYFLEVRLHPAAGHNDAGHNVYRGPKLVKIHLPKLKGMAMTGDFEGYVTFGAAFNTKPSYKYFILHEPERFVLDIAHPKVC
ncbi:AMIN-like domain-containing (lipo)protein [Streptomyces virginiae]|uniref:AMIN-like domain-containing (lipo)protein n=1 Tax=Streptomyces virginiae TaxID=1961 RepID=UPI003330BBA2